jgi:hypothetical protein
MNDTAWEKKLLEPSGVWEKGGENSPLPFALNQKTVGPAKESSLQSIIKKS